MNVTQASPIEYWNVSGTLHDGAWHSLRADSAGSEAAQAAARAMLAGELGMSNAATLTQTNNYQAWIKLMHNGAPMHPRLMRTFAPPPEGARFEKVAAFARDRHMKPRAYVEERIAASFPKVPAKRARHTRRRDADRR